MKEYPRFVGKGHKPFDPIKLAESTETIVAKGEMRKYTDFYGTGVYGGISTGYTVGCMLRCIFCWVGLSREFPERMGEFYTPERVAELLIENAERRRVKRLRISGGEPTLVKPHLLRVLEILKKENYLFILETNGILWGYDPGYVKDLSPYPNTHIRLCIKAGTREGFERRTGAKGEFYLLPYEGVKNLIKYNLSFHVACMSDPRLTSNKEKEIMLTILRKVGYKEYLEEEVCDSYDTTLLRLKKAEYKIGQT